ncbi:hypothetical protein ACL7TT_05015 [Microbulbifer sp. 2304DJ12-6]
MSRHIESELNPFNTKVYQDTPAKSARPSGTKWRDGGETLAPSLDLAGKI